jgi:hypothetical protein
LGVLIVYAIYANAESSDNRNGKENPYVILFRFQTLEAILINPKSNPNPKSKPFL